MNRLRELFTRNKVALAVMGVAAVVGLALVARKRAGSGDVAEGGYGGTAQAGALAPYDSTASDVYNAIQPQIEYLQNLARGIPVASDTPAPASLGVWAHYRDDGTGGAYYELFDDFTSRIVGSGEATVKNITAKGRLNDEQFAQFKTPRQS